MNTEDETLAQQQEAAASSNECELEDNAGVLAGDAEASADGGETPAGNAELPANNAEAPANNAATPVNNAGEPFADFVATIAALRAPNGCPWDREQTHASIAKNMIEEAYEAVDAIEAADTAHLREELGDVLLQVVLQSQIAADEGEFTINDVCRDINAKMIRRHPHVFGEGAHAENAGEVLDLWDKVKLAEKNAANAQAAGEGGGSGSSSGGTSNSNNGNSINSNSGNANANADEGLLDSIPTGFPALMQAQKISRKAVSVGFEWDTLDDVWEQTFSEIDELKTAYAAAEKDAKGRITEEHKAAAELELGDVLFSLVNVARRMGLDAESALRASCKKFRNRWAFIEGAACGEGRKVEDLSMDEMQQLWDFAKMLEM